MNLKKIKLLGILMCFGLFLASCSDDDDNNYQTYNTNSGNLIYNGEAATTAIGAEFIIEINNNGKATLIANNAVIGNPSLRIENVELTEANGKTSFSIVNVLNNNDRDITFNGTISDGKLTIEGNVEFKSNVLGTWEMPLDQDFLTKKMGIVDWSATIKSGLDSLQLAKAEDTNGLLELLGNMIGSTIGSEVDQLSINFKSNGMIAVKYRTITDNQTHEGLPLGLALNYFIRDGKIFVAMPADILKAIPADLKKNEVIAAALSLIKEEGGYAYVELKMTKGEIHKDEIGTYTLFYVDDAVFSVLNPVIVNYLKNNIENITIPLPEGSSLNEEQVKILISNIASGLPYLENYKFGLGFKKIEP